ncbi:sodium-dependent transporter [Selenomonas sp. TAMA-11512]|uniref:sodium-dependent transporter n=1 Tax=Selenomonas sp. TAMA-11512 TaxID=3095337 RepID=UPI003085D194|nr:sodium-dependent transporter [Selenomonas sp. TAMA-11512]
MSRETLGSRLGFILISAGCAIGIGNVWKFPYMVGENGGGAFVLIYLLFLIILGVPVMTMEFAMGRAAAKSPVRIYQKLVPDKEIWHWHGLVMMAGNYLLMMFYTTVSGWMLLYFFKTATGSFAGLEPKGVADAFTGMLADPVLQVVPMTLIVVTGFFIVSRGLQSGLERITKVMMLLLFVIMVILAVNSVFLPGAEEGIRFYLTPDFAKMQEHGIVNVAVGAMNQAFFTLSLGIGALAIFGSYISKDRSLFGEALNVAALDTFVAFVSGLIVIPACFAYGVEPGAGPGLIFITLPNIFNHMPGGEVWGSLFFIFMTFAAFSTVLAVFENIIACTMDIFYCSRKKAAYVNMALIFLLSLPCALGFNVLSDLSFLPEGKTFLDLEDFLVSNILLPGGALLYVLFCMHRYGWGAENFYHEANMGKGAKLPGWARPYFTFILPLIVGSILVMGLL